MLEVQQAINPSNGLKNALDVFDALSLNQKNELINKYKGKKENFPIA
jgi:hypothetical protein